MFFFVVVSFFLLFLLFFFLFYPSLNKMLYISNTLLCIPISILIKAMQTKQNASGEGKYVQICALSSDMKKKKILKVCLT